MKRLFQTLSETLTSALSAEKEDASSKTDPSSVLRRSEFLFEQWYRKKYAVADHFDAVSHYLTIGAAKYFDPNPLFRCSWYVETYKLPAEIAKNAALHYLMVGSQKGLRPNAYFDPTWYRASYPEVAGSGMEPLVHYLKFGAKEGRHPCADTFTQWLPQGLDETTGSLENPLTVFLDLLDLLKKHPQNV